jgi:SAM-dependent methyltransferase
MDPLEKFKAAQKAGWAHFAPLQVFTTMPAGRLVEHVGVRPGMRVLDVACGTGVVAVTAARLGAKVTGLDLTPELLEVATINAKVAALSIDFHEGDVEQLPFDASTFDVVVSQFGHMFAPRPEVAIGQMLRVLKPGGTIGFSTWPPELLIGRLFSIVGQYMPPPPPGVSPPVQWGDPTIIRERLGQAVRDIVFDRGRIEAPALSPAHYRDFTERTAGPMLKLVESLSASDPARLAQFRADCDALMTQYFDRNFVRQDYLMTRAVKI